MTTNTQPFTGDYIAVIEPVKEITLTGSADLGYWQTALRGTGLFPFVTNGRASLLISAISSNFRGLPFREFTVSVYISEQQDGRSHDGFYLAYAFNSSRLLAFSERAFFKTPYFPADVAVTLQPRSMVSVKLGGREFYHSVLAAGRSAERHEDEVWEGPIYLPTDSPRGKVFYARLGGPTSFYPFAKGDTLTIMQSSNAPTFEALADSGFEGEQWRIGENSSHARSRTYDPE